MALKKYGKSGKIIDKDEDLEKLLKRKKKEEEEKEKEEKEVEKDDRKD